ncbi:hypothetical protein [Sphingopyxis sp.]|uniref:hypothetical protein n=1 Tax=Sphingopyxis sp. TaxID=1908224 RepID=UPI003D0E4ED2
MRFLYLRRVGPLVVIALAWCLWPTAASAQAYACPGPGPGERMVGMTQGGNGVAPVPLCVRDDSGGSPPPPAPPAEAHAALVWHPDAADVWVDGNYTGANNPGEANALAACTKVMGAGCSPAGTWWNSSMTIIRDKAGYFYKGWAGEDGLERKQAIADCSAKQLLPCEIFKTIGSGTNRRFPGADVRKSYAASAWVIGTVDEGYDHKLYVASGYRSSDEATTAAVKACGDATGRKCEANALTGNGFIQAYRLGGTDDSATVETSAKRAKEAAKANCQKLKATSCALQAQFDSRKSGLFVHDFAKAKAP